VLLRAFCIVSGRALAAAASLSEHAAMLCQLFHASNTPHQGAALYVRGYLRAANGGVEDAQHQHTNIVMPDRVHHAVCEKWARDSWHSIEMANCDRIHHAVCENGRVHCWHSIEPPVLRQMVSKGIDRWAGPEVLKRYVNGHRNAHTASANSSPMGAPAAGLKTNTRASTSTWKYGK